MGFLAAEGDGPALHALGSLHDAEGQVEFFQDGALLNVELEVSGEVFLLNSGIADAFDRVPAVTEDGFEGKAVAIGPDAVGFDGVRSGEGRGAEEAAAKASALFVSPIDQLYRDRGLPLYCFARLVRTSRPAITPRQPSSQPPFGTESRWLPKTRACADAPGSVTQ